MGDQDAERELRELLEHWLQASSRKDIEGTMAAIAEDCLNFEHQTPIQYAGKEAIRKSCQEGFDAQPDGWELSMPGSKVIVSGDLAVQYGLNRMAGKQDGKITAELWSRGTRVFRKIDGQWKMIHQHLSFPYDPATGQVAMNGPGEEAGAA